MAFLRRLVVPDELDVRRSLRPHPGARQHVGEPHPRPDAVGNGVARPGGFAGDGLDRDEFVASAARALERGGDGVRGEVGAQGVGSQFQRTLDQPADAQPVRAGVELRHLAGATHGELLGRGDVLAAQRPRQRAAVARLLPVKNERRVLGRNRVEGGHAS